MEKEWEDFWVTGRVSDYLNYKDCYKDESEPEDQKASGLNKRKQGNRGFHGTDNYGDGDGDKHHAYIGL